jgi:4-amino-4-deoxychorismate lyase
MKLWINGAICDEAEAVIPLTDHGFLYGMGLFETFRTYGGRPFLLGPHLARLRSGLAELRIDYEPMEDKVVQVIADLLSVNRLEDGYVRISVSAGRAPLGLPGPAGYTAPNVSIIVKALPTGKPPPKSLFALSLPRSTPEGSARRKSFHYMNNILGKWELSGRTQQANAEGLFLTGDGHVVEGLVSNVFHVKAGVLYTPSLETGCLLGVTREAVIRLASKLTIPVVEGRFSLKELAQAEELFVTNSIQEMVPVQFLFDAQGSLLKAWDVSETAVIPRIQEAYQTLVKGGAGIDFDT